MADGSTLAEEILGIAIEMERQERAFYLDWAARIGHPGAARLLVELAREEEEHEALFRRIRERGDVRELARGEVPPDLHLDEYLVTAPPGPESTPQDVLIHAIRTEQNAIDLYSAWASLHAGTDLEPLLDGLVEEERRHKARLEALYQDQFLEDW
ncbi:MAG TPA: ferritin family protein [Myxococcota bacterium]|nr:ferritin family protein [Myxococcota bacterium]HQK50236.1 ferritin family protein [Myxococcota bacterium]